MNVLKKYSRKQKSLTKRGFTLIELIIVVAILGIFMAIAVPSLYESMFKARNTGVEANLKTLSDCEARLQIHYAKIGVKE